MRAIFRVNSFLLVFILHIKSLHCESTIAVPVTSVGSNITTSSTLANNTTGLTSIATYESHYAATSHNGTATTVVPSSTTYTSTKNTSAPASLGTTGPSNGNSTENYTVSATATSVSFLSSSPTSIHTLTNTNATTTNITNNGSYVSTVFTTAESVTTNATNNTVGTTIQFNTTHISSDNSTTPSVLTNTKFFASTHLSSSVSSTLPTTKKQENVTTVQSTDASLSTENTTVVVNPKTSSKPTEQPTTNSSYPILTGGSPKDAQTSGGVVFGAIIGSILGIVMILLVGYFICGVRKPDAFTHRRLYEDIKNEPVLRLDDSVEPYDVRYGASSYHNPTVVEEPEYRHVGNKLDFIPMDNLPSNNPSA
ncbi:mucin-15 [Lissotriton helveticus]